MKGLLRDRTIGSYMGLLSLVIAIGTALAMVLYGRAVKDFLPICTLLLLLGAAVAIVAFVADKIPFLPIVPGVCYIVAMGLYLKRELMTISNYFNRITLGNSGSAFQIIMLFIGLILAAAILAVISSFFNQKKG